MLSERLAAMADTQEVAMRDRLHAALRIGAELALARIREIGGNYPSGSDVSATVEELMAEPEPEGRIEFVAASPVDPLPEPSGPQF